MTVEEQYAIIGRAHHEWRETRKQLAMLEVRRQMIADAAYELAEAMHHPASVIVPGTGESVAVAKDGFAYTTEIAAQLRPEFVAAFVAEYRAMQQKLARLRQQLIDLGQGDPGPAQ